MIKKICILIFVTIIISSCGKKGDPVYKKENQSLLLLEGLMEKQISLIINWMRVGFIHGVMNTDNMSMCGETIDYGPCAFMNHYDPSQVYSSIDYQKRYSFNPIWMGEGN